MRIWLKKWWWIFAIPLIIVSAFTPQIIDWFYPKKVFWFTLTTFNKQDILVFYGSFLAFLGTVALGSLALWQNIKLNKINEMQGEEIKRNTKRPFFIIEDVKRISEDKPIRFNSYGEPIKNDNYFEFNDQGIRWFAEGAIKGDRNFAGAIELKNIGDGVAIDVEYKIAPFVGVNLTNNCIINTYENFRVPIDIVLSYGHQVDFLILIKYRNILGCEYIQTMEYGFTEFPMNSENYQIVVKQISEQLLLEYLNYYETKLEEIELKYYCKCQEEKNHGGEANDRN